MPKTEWEVADAKARLSELLNSADGGMQIIKRRNRRYVLMREESYEKLACKTPSLKAALLNGPSLAGVDLVSMMQK